MELSNSLFSIDKINLNESEKFCLQLEELIKLWNLCLDDDLEKEQLNKKIEFINCFDLNFRIELIENDKIRKKKNLKNLLDNILNKIKEVNYLNSNDIKFIERIYGVNNFILIKTDNDLDIIESERIIRLINSSISCSIINTKCIYPIFIQIKDLIYELSIGLFINFGIRIQYDSALFDLNQFNLNTLADFLKIFENKLKRNLQLEDNVRCFLANRRYLNNYFIKFDNRFDTNFNILFNNNLDNNQELKIEFKNLKLINHLKNLRFQIIHTEILPKIHGTQWIYSADELITKQFNKLENGCLNIKINYLDQSNIFKSIKFMNEFLNKKQFEYYLQLNNDQFKNLDEYNQFCNDNDRQNYLNYFMVNDNLKNEFIDNNKNLFKSTTFNSIIFRFSNYIFNLYISKLMNDNQSIDLIYKRILFEINDFWSSIVDQLRRYWELCDLIPSVEYELPDLKSNLLTQKIQMLNCCIKEKEKRESLNYENLDHQSEDDEFYDCEDNHDEEDQAEGRLKKLEFNLLNDKNRFIYEPITQNLTPFTEDNQDEYSNAYCGLNLIDNLIEKDNIDELLIGKNIFLISDMQAFKAANPGCCFEDFIRWHSPNDFLESKLDQKTDESVLSERFQSDNCLWRKIWNQTKPLPISRQKRLFNYSMEAERILNYLNTIKLKELIKYLFSTIVQIGCLKYKQIIDNLKFKSNELINYFNEQINKIGSRLKNNDNIDDLLIDLDNEIFQYIGLIYLFEQTEFNYEFYNNSIEENRIDDKKNLEVNNQIEKRNLNKENLRIDLNNQLNDTKSLINELIKNKFLKINKTDLNVFNGLNRMFNLDNFKQLKQYENSLNLELNTNHLINQCLDKEYTFIADCTRPENYSRKLPQKLNFIVRSNLESRKFKIQMNGQYAEDNVYF